MKRIIPKLIGSALNMTAIISPDLAGEIGFNLFCQPGRPKLKDHQNQFLDSSVNSYFEFEGNRINYYKWGNGKRNIVFIHGWQSHSFRWKNYIEAINKDEYSIYALDAPGHGRSGGKYLNLPIYSRVIEQFLEYLQSTDTIISHSLGSFASLYTLYRKPQLAVKKLVITGCPGEANEFVDFYQELLGLSFKTIQAIRKSFDVKLNHLPEYFSASKFAAAVSIPGLIIHDWNDKEVAFKHASEIKQAWTNSELMGTVGLGHNLRSVEVIDRVIHFLERSNEISIISQHKVHS